MASIGKNLIEELKWTADDLQAQLDDLKAKIAALEGLAEAKEDLPGPFVAAGTSSAKLAGSNQADLANPENPSSEPIDNEPIDLEIEIDAIPLDIDLAIEDLPVDFPVPSVDDTKVPAEEEALNLSKELTKGASGEDTKSASEEAPSGEDMKSANEEVAKALSGEDTKAPAEGEEAVDFKVDADEPVVPDGDAVMPTNEPAVLPEGDAVVPTNEPAVVPEGDAVMPTNEPAVVPEGDAVVPTNEPAVVPEASSQTSSEGEICSGKPQTEQKEEKAAEVKPTSIPKAGKVYRWHTDMPGAPVNNIISGISLNERVRFINALFGEDPILFQANISRLNAMGSLSEAEEYLTSTFPDWKLDSELVYLFMMAVRRKLR
ncbi:MAG: hypothetical protein SOZ66_06000 [Candidatus Cryptobacteroides sp.]|nr:hypothetical protein [Candidatus Cryptobacteroides sp.]